MSAASMVPHRMSLDDFRGAVEVRPMPKTRRRDFEVFFNGRSFGFVDGREPAGTLAHKREVYNALVACQIDAPAFKRGGVLPSAEALAPYPYFEQWFPREYKLAMDGAEWSVAYSERACAEGWAIFDAGGESQIQRLDEEGILSTDDQAWKIVMSGNEDHHVVARTIIFRDAPAEWDRMKVFTEANKDTKAQQERPR